MSGATALDLRIPIGGLFTIIGVLVAGYGLATGGDAAMYARSAGVNLNLVWGAVMLLFGVLMLLAARRSTRAAGARPAEQTAEGRATETRERQLGLEGPPTGRQH